MDYLRRFHLNGLRAVEAIGRFGTLARAAEELGVSSGAVSQQLLKTEQQLGRPVFERTSKGLVPTPFGRLLLPYLESGFRELSRGVALADQPNQTLLTVSVAPAFAAKWLVPRLFRFQEAHADIRVRLDASVDLVDFDHSDVDVAVRFGQGKWPNVKSELLIEQKVFPVCAPAFKKRLRLAKDISKVPIIRDQNSIVPWSIWLALHNLTEDVLAEGPRFSDASLCLDAAIAGQGILLGWETLAIDALKDGRLIKPFSKEAITGFGYWFVTSSARGPDKKISAFRRWLKQEVELMN
jgi:LysR family transcriptional regulator, glycine cleavage system transcriptional activator